MEERNLAFLYRRKMKHQFGGRERRRWIEGQCEEMGSGGGVEGERGEGKGMGRVNGGKRAAGTGRQEQT